MRVLAVFCAVLALTAAVPLSGLIEKVEMVVDHEIIDAINRNKTSWEAGVNERFIGMTVAEFRQLLGARFRNSSLPVKTHPVASIPAEFDARTQWPDYIHPIRDQERCGSCWAFAASEAFSDRLAIASAGKINKVLSPEDMVSCDKSDAGCGGGYLDKAWQYLENTGIVTDACFPYTAGSGIAPACVSKCVDGESFTKYKTKDAFQIRTVSDIQTEIMTNGPVEGGFRVYRSFMSYKSGVYQRHWWQVWDTLEGGHAIKILGWGSENGVDYWLCANSWTTSWGEEGLFKIRRGVNECEIESQIFAGHPAL